MMNSNSDFRLGEIGETERDSGRSSNNICKECVATGLNADVESWPLVEYQWSIKHQWSIKLRTNPY